MSRAARSNRPSKREVVVIDSDESDRDQPVVKSVKKQVEPVPSKEVLDLRQQVAKLEKDREGALRYARKFELQLEEANKRVLFLENILDKKPTPIDDIRKNVVKELQMKLTEQSTKLEEATRREEDAARKESEVAQEIADLKFEIAELRRIFESMLAPCEDDQLQQLPEDEPEIVGLRRIDELKHTLAPCEDDQQKQPAEDEPTSKEDDEEEGEIADGEGEIELGADVEDGEITEEKEEEEKGGEVDEWSLVLDEYILPPRVIPPPLSARRVWREEEKTVVCRNHLKRYCFWGEQCYFLHPPMDQLHLYRTSSSSSQRGAPVSWERAFEEAKEISDFLAGEAPIAERDRNKIINTKDIFELHVLGTPGSIPFSLALEQLRASYHFHDAAWEKRCRIALKSKRLECKMCCKTTYGFTILHHFFSVGHLRKQIHAGNPAVSVAAFEYWKEMLESIPKTDPI